DYIKKIYLYLVGIGGLIATVLIIKGGFEWTTSAGNPTRVTSAKSSITSALMGLFLLLGSYTLLYTINPDLLRLKLPRVFMVRALTLGTEWCKDQEDAKLVLAKATPTDKQRELKDYKPGDFTLSANPEEGKVKQYKSEAGSPDALKMPICGASYYTLKSSDSTCAGHLCKNDADGKPQACIEETKDNYKCVKGLLSGTITGNGIVAPFIDNNLRLMTICKDGTPYAESIDLDTDKKATQQSYVFTVTAEKLKSEVINADGTPKPCGFFLAAEINDDNGNDDVYAIGKDGTVCNKNLHQLMGWKDVALEAEWWTEAIKKFDTLYPFLIKFSDLENGMVCDIPLSRTAFPEL
ncbi:MAG: pilin, partial [Patescibacteria group bacterium]